MQGGPRGDSVRGMKLRTLLGGLVAALGLSVAACGGGGNPNYRVPVDSPLMSFQAPEKEEILGAEGGEDLDLTQPVEEEKKPEPAPAPKPAPPPTPAPAAKAPAKAPAAKPAPAPKAPPVTPAPGTKPQ